MTELPVAPRGFSFRHRDVLARFLVVAASLWLVTPDTADARSVGDAAKARRGLAQAVASGRVQALDAERYRAYVASSVKALTQLPRERAANLRAVLHDVAAQASRLNQPRALALFSMLDMNTRYLRRAAMPPAGSDVVDVDGIVYRAFPGRGLQFHPLANFGKLNAAVAAGRNAEGHRLLFALLARGVPTGQALVWEYYFRYAGGAPPWRSGMAQAVAAQSLARAGFRTQARRAYLAVPGALLTRLSVGPWIRLYSFSPVVVLNAQLQSAISLADYAALANDAQAAALGERLEASATSLLPRFDTGYWSLYALNGSESSLGYHRYVVSLLEKLALRTANETWTRWAARFQLYARQPVTITPGPASPVVFSRPVDGFRDVATISFRLSKISTVTLLVAGERRSLTLGRGPHTLAWNAAGRPPGAYAPRLRAVDLAGNVSEVELPRVTVTWDTEPPVVVAHASGRRVLWRALDAGTPWLRLVVRLERRGHRKVLDLGRHPLTGSARMRLPRGTWTGTLLASDSAGNRAEVPLGPLGAQA